METHRLVSGGLVALSAALALAPGAASPALGAAPSSVRPGGTLTLDGSGFGACKSQTVVLSVDGTGVQPATADVSNGDFHELITIPAISPTGSFTAIAQCSTGPSGGHASTSVDVVTLSISSSSGIPGTTITARGNGWLQCHEVQARLMRAGTQVAAVSDPTLPPGGALTAQVTVPVGTIPGSDYEVDAGCYPVVSGAAPLASEPFTVESLPVSLSPTPTPPSPTPSSAAPSSTSPSPTPTSPAPTSPAPTGTGPATSASPSPSSAVVVPPPHDRGHTGGPWTPVALIGGSGAGAALMALLAVRASSLLHGRRTRGWVSKHLRVEAGRFASLSAGVERRPGQASVSVGLESHPGHPADHRYEEVPR